MGFVLLWYGLIQFITQQVFNVSLYDQAIPRDLAANLILGAILYAITRNLRWYLPTIAVVMAVIHLSNAGKIIVLGSPIMPDDFLAVRNLFLLLEGWQLFAVIAIVVIPLLLLLAMTAWRRVRTWILLSSVGIAAAVLVLAPVPVVHAMDGWFGNVVWDQRGNFEDRGLLIHLTQETARYLAHGKNPPTAEEVQSAMTNLRLNHSMTPPSSPANNSPQRNVHVIVLESFWDPALLTAVGLSNDPLDPEFRALWRETGNSHALSPVFGGYTANTEFEVLCGFPVTEDSVFFEGGLRHDVPCLPRLLGSEGYRTIASHPNIAAFWNRVNAYQRIGFDTYWSIDNFVSDDINRDFLSDSSMYRQVMEKTGPLLDAGKPVFNYILTIFGHLDYPLNAQRPAVIEAVSGSKMVQDYANTIYYKSRELMDFLKLLRARDPDGLILLFGDHLPFLGPNFDGFTESGLLADNRSKFDARMFHTLVATPLIIIDGKKGPRRVGDVPIYQLPQMILEMLGNQQPSLMHMSKAPDGVTLRPLPGMYFVDDQREQKVCHQGDDQDVDSGKDNTCADTAQWVHALITLTQDLFNGHQYSLRTQ